VVGWSPKQSYELITKAIKFSSKDEYWEWLAEVQYRRSEFRQCKDCLMRLFEKCASKSISRKLSIVLRQVGEDQERVANV